jgi:hypothetical protein
MYRLLRPLGCFAALLLLQAGMARAQDKTVPRFVEFRDGSILRLQVVEEPWKLTVVLGTGKIETMAVKPSAVNSLALTEDEDFAKKRKLLAAVQQLGSSSFPAREQAWQTLFRMGPVIRPDLQACLQLTSDEETRVRLHELVTRLSEADKTPAQVRVAFDRFQIASAAGPIDAWGYLGEQPIGVVVNGRRYPLTRKNVLRVSVAPPGTRPAAEGTLAGFARIGPGDFPKDCVEEGFDTDPLTNRKLQPGENVEKMFVGKGFVLSTSVPKSFVAVNNFVVTGGKSGGLSVANHEPLWEGEITIKFVRPGLEHLPTGVSHFGCYIAAVVPGGTELIAYDLQGRELGKIATRVNGTDFLGVRSEVPIHTIRIVPNPQIDPNYTLDDFIFLPALTAQPAHPTKCTAYLAGGDVVLCKDVTLQSGKVVLHGLPGGLPDLTLPLDELSRVNLPRHDQASPTRGLFAELKDGSVLFAPEPKDPRQMPVFSRRPNLLKDRNGLAGLWTTRSPRKTPPPKTPTALWSEEEQNWQPVSYVRLLEELVMWKGPDGKFAAAGYQKVPPLWLAPPKAGPTASWCVRTTLGEVLVLTEGQSLAGRLSQEVNVTWQGEPLRLPAAEVVAIYRTAGK